MNVKQLKEFIKDLPDEMPVGIIDLTTDDVDYANYPINEDTLWIDDYVNMEESEMEVKGKMLFFTFENKLNENPI